MSIATQAQTHVAKNTIGIRLNLRGLTAVHWAAMSFATITGTIHLYLYLYATQSFVPFLLAGLGFLTAAGLVLTTFDRRVLYLGGIPFTMAQIGAWISLGMPDFQFGVVDKTIQIALIATLAYLFVRDRSERRERKVAQARTQIQRSA